MTTSHLFKHSAGAPSPCVWLWISRQNHQLHLGRSAMHALAPAIAGRSWRTKSRRQNVDTVDTYMAKPEDTRQKKHLYSRDKTLFHEKLRSLEHYFMIKLSELANWPIPAPSASSP